MGKEALSKAETEALIRELELKLQRLRTTYEQYFMGIEKIPPTVRRKEVVRLVRRLDNVFVRHTASKFRVRSLVQKFNTYKAYWSRVERQMEEGTYVRDIQRARRNKVRREEAEGTGEPSAAPETGGSEEFVPGNVIDLDLGESLADLERELNAEADAAVAPPVQTPYTPQPGEPQPANPLNQTQADLGIKQTDSSRAQKLKKLQSRLNKKSEASEELPIHGASVDQVQKLARAKAKIQEHQREQQQQQRRDDEDTKARAVYEKLLAAKKQCNEGTAGITFENVKSSLAKQKEHLKTTRGAKDVEFQVVIKNGKAFLKPQLK